MDEEDAQISKIAAFILVVIIVILATILLGCGTKQTSVAREVETEADVYWCLGACGGARTQHEVDSTKTMEKDDE